MHLIKAICPGGGGAVNSGVCTCGKKRIGFESLWGSLHCIMVNSVNGNLLNLVDRLNHNNVLSRKHRSKMLILYSGIHEKRNYVKWVSREYIKEMKCRILHVCVYMCTYSLNTSSFHGSILLLFIYLSYIACTHSIWYCPIKMKMHSRFAQYIELKQEDLSCDGHIYY